MNLRCVILLKSLEFTSTLQVCGYIYCSGLTLSHVGKTLLKNIINKQFAHFHCGRGMFDVERFGCLTKIASSELTEKVKNLD